MQYRVDKKSGNKLSVLGLGCMRLPSSAAKSEAVIMKAYNAGINFFDTAYLYPNSEAALGNALHKNGIREKVYIATKLPKIKCHSYDDFDKYFNIQLERLKTDYIDYYFMHNISRLEDWEHLVELGIEKWISEKKAEGKIKQLGFSFHGARDVFTKMINAYDWDFCMIQYNYINTHYQAGQDGLKYAYGKGIPVFVMEPLLGGSLVNGLPDKAVKLLKQHKPETSPASWALRWLWNQPEVTMVLSGMNDVSQIEENTLLAKTLPGSMSSEELKIIDQVIAIFSESYKIPCTGCNYCLPCPANINIPNCFAAYNTSYAIGYIAGMTQYATGTSVFTDKPMSILHCTKCGKCEKACPQDIKIVKCLVDVRKRMEPFWYRWVMAVARKVRSR